jgi:hypothetical protein
MTEHTESEEGVAYVLCWANGCRYLNPEHSMTTERAREVLAHTPGGRIIAYTHGETYSTTDGSTWRSISRPGAVFGIERIVEDAEVLARRHDNG